MKITNWIEGVGLCVAAKKTEAVLFTRKRNARRGLKIKVLDTEVEWKSEMRYLGVQLDHTLSYVSHIEKTSRKARLITERLAKILPNIGGPKQQRRKLLALVPQSIILYAAPVWAKAAANTKKSLVNLARCQRIYTNRSIAAYRTVSTDAASVIAASPPLHLLAEERARAYKKLERIKRGGQQTATTEAKKKVEKEERKHTIDIWQRQWITTKNGNWTRKLIPNIEARGLTAVTGTSTFT